MLEHSRYNKGRLPTVYFVACNSNKCQMTNDKIKGDDPPPLFCVSINSNLTKTHNKIIGDVAPSNWYDNRPLFYVSINSNTFRMTHNKIIGYALPLFCMTMNSNTF